MDTKKSFQIRSKKLRDALLCVSPVVSTKAYIMAFEYAHVTVKGGSLLIKGTDSYNTIYTKTEVDSSTGDFEMMVNPHVLIKLLGEMPDQDIIITHEEISGEFENTYKVHVKTEVSGTYMTNSIDPNHYPHTKPDKMSKIQVNGDELAKTLERALPFVDPKSPNTVLVGVNMRSADNCIMIVGTDAHEAYIKKIDAALGDNEINVVLMADTAKILSGFCKNMGDITINISSDYIGVSDDSTKIIGRLLDLKYPDFGPILSKNYVHSVDYEESQELLSSIKRAEVLVSLTASISGVPQYVIFDIKENISDITHIGEGSEVISSQSVPCDTVKPFSFKATTSSIKQLLSKTEGRATISLSDDERTVRIEFEKYPGEVKFMSVVKEM